MTEIDLARLPDRVREFVELLGLEEARRLLRARGGGFIYVPADPATATTLREVLNEASVTALCARYRGSSLELPTDCAIARVLRDVDICAAHAGGMSATALARRYRLTRRHVLRIVHPERRRAP
ncbi:MAG: hypothetical protein IT495_17150 [Gammaproteobacteria bacterium]|nr:hypothetical protein [Gammaproteobacteria bacterium]